MSTNPSSEPGDDEAGARLRAEIESLRRENAELLLRIDEVEKGRRLDRESRRAALNLMEDAISARRSEEREVQSRGRVEADLRDADRRKDEFLATLAHELRNPLAPIRNSLELLRLAGHDPVAIGKVQAVLERQVSHMIRLVDDLLEISRITRGKIELRKERIELASVVRNAVEISKHLIKVGLHQLAISLPAEPISLEADPVRLSQVIANLLNNAAKYTDDGGQIWLSARCDGEMAVISVRDNGLGIPPEMLPKVFELFTQVDRTLGRSQGGLGIGLSLVRMLVQAHGGTVEAQSEGLGLGSEFVVRLPLAPDSYIAPGANRPEAETKTIPGRIMVVDDNRDAADMLSTLLRFLGSEVQTVNDGPACLEAIREQPPEVILLDIGMPGMDGNEVARRIRADHQFDDVKLIALTGWGQEADRRKSREIGFDHYLVKPVEIDALQYLLRSLPRSTKDAREES